MELNHFSDIARFCPLPPPMPTRLSFKITSPLEWKFGWSVNWKIVVVILAILSIVTFVVRDVPIVNAVSYGADILFFIWLGQFRSRATGPNSVVRPSHVRRIKRGDGALAAARGYDDSYTPGMMGGSKGPFPVGKRKKRHRRDTYRS